MDVYQPSFIPQVIRSRFLNLPGLALFGLLVVHCILQWQHLSLDFWNDEAYTLEHFVLRPIAKVVGDYHAPNNHVFFSLLLHFTTSLLGINSIHDAMANPILIRLLPLCISLLALVFTYKTTVSIAGKSAGLLSVVLVITTIPFYNYALQARGYTLSMCLYAGLAWAIAYYFQRLTLGSFMAISLATALCLYTLPSNVYFIVAASLSLFIVWLILHRLNKHCYPFKRLVAMQAAIVLGVLLAFLFYVPLLSQMAEVTYFTDQIKTARSLTEVMPIVAYHFLSGRFLVLVLIVAGIITTWRSSRTYLIYDVAILSTMAIVFILPFLLSDIRHNDAPYRIYLTSLPVLISGISTLLIRCLSRIGSSRIQQIALAGFSVYCFITCGTQINKARQQALKDTQLHTRSGDLFVQYNLHYFFPRKDAQEYLAKYYSSQIPVIEACTGGEILTYLRMFPQYKPSDRPLADALARYKIVDVLIEDPAAIKNLLPSGNTLIWHQKVLLRGPRTVQFVRLTNTSATDPG